MKILATTAALLLAGLLLSACAQALGNDITVQPQQTPSRRIETNTPSGESLVTQPSPTLLLPAESPPRNADAEFSTDFSRHTIPYAKILSGGPPKDGIPAIDNPDFTSVDEADHWLKPVEPVILVKVGAEARAYPLQILVWHEIVNDIIGNLPLAVTFCPLCNTAIAFERSFDNQVLDFGTTGRLRFSNLIMYDRQTETWWQQATGEAIAGQYAGSQLELYPATIIAWQDFKTTHPEGLVLSRVTGYKRSYGQNPYTGYDDVNNPPFLYDGPQTPEVLPPVARVLTVDLNDEAVAYPYEILDDARVINDKVGGQPIAIFWAEGTASALDASSIAAGRDVGSAAAYSRMVGETELSFVFDNGRIIDQQTASEWNVLGQAVSGELLGTQLSPVVSIDHFWFSWAAFRPETRLYQP